MDTERLKTANIHYNRSGACSMAFSILGIHYEKSIVENERTERTMDIERLNEMKRIVYQSTVGGYSDFTVEDHGDFTSLIDAEIDRQKVIDEGHFPNEAEHEYNKNFEGKCERTSINVVEENATVEDVRKTTAVLEKWRESNYKLDYDNMPCGNDINLAIKALKAYQTWKPSSNPPKSSDEVLIAYGNYLLIGEISNSGDSWFLDDGSCITNGFKETYWMPLPKPPKENE